MLKRIAFSTGLLVVMVAVWWSSAFCASHGRDQRARCRNHIRGVQSCQARPSPSPRRALESRVRLVSNADCL